MCWNEGQQTDLAKLEQMAKCETCDEICPFAQNIKTVTLASIYLNGLYPKQSNMTLVAHTATIS